ncbi:Type 1 glutamine amidotransferase-like domain-containing protein [Caldalkalibacillus mannanilyticus]|uniref:Type 1 glutamine amidotransferase-like domain-containing protein n=1 Tax=Caldalkalibacillus mannanilyticus TaxID=1418 RepID=UPI001F261398|nr:Type 1 glutamine amidotransferase-like domain-containing protein [Caldalkalibacillus mannanilyticus]
MNSSGWENYVPLFRRTWEPYGVTSVEVIVPNENGEIDLAKAKEILSTSTGIFIGGGDTVAYHHHFATHPFKDWIIDRYQQGIPIAGNSAGALILPECCFISSNDHAEGVMLFKQGVGLLSDILISVHFSEWNERQNLVQAMKLREIKNGLGIDENACAVFINEQFAYSHGESVYRISV